MLRSITVLALLALVGTTDRGTAVPLPTEFEVKEIWVGDFGDPGEVDPMPHNYTVSIDWGDSTNRTGGRLMKKGDGTFAVYGTHAYARNLLDESYPITVRVAQADNPAAYITWTTHWPRPSPHSPKSP